MIKVLLLAACFSFLQRSYGQEEVKVYPTHWWVGMKNPRLQLMIHGVNLAQNGFSIIYPGVRLEKVNKVENQNYVFLDLIFSAAAKPGVMKIIMKQGNKSQV